MSSLRQYVTNPLAQANPKVINPLPASLVPQGHELHTKEIGMMDKWRLKSDKSRLIAEAQKKLQADDIANRQHLASLAQRIVTTQVAGSMVATAASNLAALMVEASNRTGLAIDSVNHSEMATMTNHLVTRNQHYSAIDDMQRQGVTSADEAEFLREHALRRAGESIKRAGVRADLAKDAVDSLYETAVGGINRAKDTLNHY